MKENLEKLWNEYISGECAVMDTEEERALSKKALERQEEMNVLMNKEQQEAAEKYGEALLELEGAFVKKAFFKGCKFAFSFLLEAGNWNK